ncbi:two-component system CheB/CheR fusion protein [Litoreibacter ponti]|uniref:protein-glutamate O-methyltransferase n=1 Tax=Litoreibacter ponti TaxID=1510457 RepID=A0A2T6BEB3_9RHOB|nr:chemotaxis protein CheB [Litoreibacter ponti]PTX54374.1 two-component system CheB/CheR fusion protein [Litoreibacter ponti]
MTDDSTPPQADTAEKEAQDEEVLAPRPEPQPDLELPRIIGIGSSAGGLEAIRELVANLPRDVNCAYVVVQHMSPQHKSLMTTLISSETTLSVVDAGDGVKPQPNTVYVTPPRTDIIIENGVLKMVEYDHEPGKPKPSVNRFLISLAEDQGSRSMGIILSGTGSDGAYGVQAIREAGGITIAQDDVSAKYDGMANAAIETGCVDLVLRPSEIGIHLLKILDTARDFEQFRADGERGSPISEILQIVLARTRVDFRDYKPSTVQRRIERRLTALGISTPEEYIEYSRNEPREVDALFKDLLISVTRFFRDKSEFEALEEQIHHLVESRSDRPLRVWVAGCATGEEVYSIAMLLAEAMGGPAELVRSKTQIFATDIDREALQIGRKGYYPHGALYDVPKALAEKYFIHQENGVRVIEALRSVILFSDHNLCQDPPFLNMDLICCRNLLIYFGAKLQSKVLARLHYAMNSSALLFVGTAEAVTGADQLFAPASDKAHIYGKRALTAKAGYQRGALSASSWTQRRKEREDRERNDSKNEGGDRAMFDMLARSLGDNAILVSNEFSFLRIYGDISPYIDMSEGNVLNMQLSLLKSPYREEARSLVTLALKHGRRRIGGRHYTGEKTDTEVRLEALPVRGQEDQDHMAILVINETPAANREMPQSGDDDASDLSGEHLRELDLELANAREALQQTIEELETSNEELQALNEELQSTNEELQATNEELETSNEELQSTNEELITVNEEMQVNSSELMALNAKLGSVLGNVPMPLLVLDTALQISSASHDAVEIFNISTPLKLPHLSQINLPQGFPKIVEVANRALQYGELITIDFESQGHLFNLQCAPFTGEAGQLIGATMVFMETPSARNIEEDEQLVVRNAPLHFLQFDEEGTVEAISEQTAEALGVVAEQIRGGPVAAAFRNTDIKVRGHDVSEILLKGLDSSLLMPMVRAPGSKPRWASVQRFSYTSEDGKVSTVIAGSDVTEVLDSKAHGEQLNDDLVTTLDTSGVGYWTADMKTEEVAWSDRVYKIHGLSPDAYTPDLRRAIDFYHPQDRADVRAKLDAAMKSNAPSQAFRKRIFHTDGRLRWIEGTISTRAGLEGGSSYLIGTFRDVSDEVLTEARFEQMQKLNVKSGMGFMSYDVLTQHAFWCPTAYSVLGFSPDQKPGYDTLVVRLHPDDIEAFTKLHRDALTSGAGFDTTVRVVGPSEEFRVNIIVDTTLDQTGNCTHYYGTVKRV